MSHGIAPGRAPDAGLATWSAEPLIALPVLAAAVVYTLGWRQARRQMPARFDGRHLAAFLAGLGALLAALASPLDALAAERLSAHMAQHLLLMLVAPPLLWLGAPVAPLLLGLPHPLRRAVATALGTAPLRELGRVLAHPAVAWVAFTVAFWVWHIPALYDLALREEGWHDAEHAAFLGAALLFWRPVILPWPARQVWPRWAMIPYLVLAEFQNMVLAAIFTFSDRVIYTAYETSARPGAMSALEDQALAGVLMWVPGSLAFAWPVIWLVIEGLRPAPSVDASVVGTRR
ncbi:MAG: cytochrome c oxidase assembly protein [Candidatus Rokubacteria bacterium]|nr:cytochrome c oxidase assembly protein [Candidatus Rokubacteria bacterium]